MPVPKAAMHENRLAKSGEDKIGAPGQVAPVQTITITHAVNEATHHHFRLGVLGPNTSHALATFGGGENIGHVSLQRSMDILAMAFMPVKESERHLRKLTGAGYLRGRSRLVAGPPYRWV
jgi:hypothetical protein